MKKRYGIIPLFLAIGFAGGCEEKPDLSRSLDPECLEKYERLGAQVLAEFAVCDDDVDCTLSQAGAGCVSPFLCPRAIARGNEAAYAEASSLVVEEFLAECGNFCAIADCSGPESLRTFCDTSIGQCATEYVPPGVTPASE